MTVSTDSLVTTLFGDRESLNAVEPSTWRDHTVCEFSLCVSQYRAVEDTKQEAVIPPRENGDKGLCA